MTLAAGMRLGPYEILAPLGVGGMGEVYKAKDTRLDRTVAIKVLPSRFSADPQFRERFEREARAISSLTHPYICALYDIGQQDGTDFLVLEYLEGETVAARLAKGAIPLDQALQYAVQIAAALDHAHRHGIIHRDLKPGNIMVTKSGVKVLDFGLAKSSAPAVATAGLSTLPTTPPNLTAPGTILGTFQYMAPEQLEGREADVRADIFAFGAVAYEMLTGKNAFEGKSPASLIAAILEREPPPLSQLVTAAPPLLDHIVKKCLAKDPDARWQSARDLHDGLQWVADEATRAARSTGVAPLIARRTRERIAWGLAAIGLVAAFAFAIPRMLASRRAVEPLVTRLDVVTPPTADPFGFALSPDGRQLVFIANGENGSQLWLRRFDQGAAQPLAGTDGGTYPFWSPDNRLIGFFADAKLKRLDLGGGSPQVLAAAPFGRGGTWNREGIIVFAPSNNSTLMRVPAAGGSIVPVTAFGLWPQFLPDGRRFIFFGVGGTPPAPGVFLGTSDGGQPTAVSAAETAAVFSPPDQLLLLRQGVLFAQRFSPVSGFISGDPVPVAQSVGATTAGAAFHGAFSSSETGVLAYRSGAAARRQLVWVDRTGKELDVLWPSDAGGIAGPMLTRDGRRVAVTRIVQGNSDVWMMDVGRRIMTRFTVNPADGVAPVWSPDGSRVMFRASRNGKFDLFEKPANGGGDEQPLLVTAQDKQSLDWSSDGRFILYAAQDPQTGSDLWALPLDADRKPIPVAHSGFEESQGQFSPDGRWVAYVSNETGRYEIYVREFPDAGGKWQVSAAGGIYPRWRLDGNELFYIGLDNRMMAVQVELTPATRTVSLRTPIALFATHLVAAGNLGVAGYAARSQYAVAADGRFLMNVAADEVTPPITIVQNWTTALKR